MVVLAVTWMAKAGHDADVIPIMTKLAEESRKEPGVVMFQVHRHKTEPRRFFIYDPPAPSKFGDNDSVRQPDATT